MVSLLLVVLGTMLVIGIIGLLIVAKVVAKLYRRAGRHAYSRHGYGRQSNLLAGLLGMMLERGHHRRHHDFGHHRRHQQHHHRHYGGSDWDDDWDD